MSIREPYIDARRLAAVMGVSLSTIKRMVAAGMPSEKWGTRTRRFLASEAIEWARSRDPSRTVAPIDQLAERRLTSAGRANPKE